MHDFKIKFYENPIKVDTIQNDYLLLFVIHGSVSVTLSSDTIVLCEKDTLLIHANRHFILQSLPESFFMEISIDSNLLRKSTQSQVPHFQCCSALYSGMKYEQLRYFIEELLGECALNTNNMNAKKLSTLYKLCDHLIQAFLLSDKQALSENSDERLDHAITIFCDHLRWNHD